MAQAKAVPVSACDLCGTMVLIPRETMAEDVAVGDPISQCGVTHFGGCLPEPESCDGSQTFRGYLLILPVEPKAPFNYIDV